MILLKIVQNANNISLKFSIKLLIEPLLNLLTITSLNGLIGLNIKVKKFVISVKPKLLNLLYWIPLLMPLKLLTTKFTNQLLMLTELKSLPGSTHS